MRSKVLICAYREWAHQIYFRLLSDPRLTSKYQFISIIDPESLVKKIEVNPEIIICIGWSWKVPDEITTKHFVCGLHPSDLPKYAGGSPIQHQILDGLRQSKNTLFKFTSDIDNGPIIEKMEFSLDGKITEIFHELTITSLILITNFLLNYPNIEFSKPNLPIVRRKRLKPEESKLDISLPKDVTAKDLYNKIRCRQSPYPNAFFEDSSGILRFLDVEFTEK